MYLLDNIIVSNSHIIKHTNSWIPVSKHPNSVKCEYYNEPYLYCLNTTSKTIKINNQVFTDWDEIYDDSLDKILNNTIIPINKREEIHKYLDLGFAKSTSVGLIDGTYKKIDKVLINDVLKNGEIVYGIVEIDGSDITKNVLYNLGENSFEKVKEYNLDLHIYKQDINADNLKLYHLLTDKKTFQLGNIIISDYNAAIDRFLEITI